jgi:streptogramin lyase
MRAGSRSLGLVLSVLFAGCASPGTPGSLPLRASNPAAKPSAAEYGSRKKVLATLRIAIPQRRRHRARIGAHYISAATQSIAVSFTASGGGAPLTFNLNLTPATNPNCTAALVCTLSFAIRPGNYTATFATYDGLLSGGVPTGNKLSAQTVPVTIVTGKINALNITLDAIPVGAVLIPGATSTLLGNMASGFSLGKCGSPPQKITVLGLDADGNYILGPGAPVPSLHSSDPVELPVSGPSAARPNTFTLTPPAIAVGNEQIAMNATVTPAAGSGGVGQTTQVRITYTGDICGQMTEFTIPTLSSQPQRISAGPDGEMWFTELSGNKIGRITTDGSSIHEYTIPSGDGSRPFGIVTGPDGNLWFTTCTSPHLDRVTTTGTITSLGAIQTSRYLVTGPDKAVWFTEPLVNNVGRMTTNGTYNEYPITSSTSSAAGIAAGKDGDLWFVECANDLIGRMTTTGTMVAEYPMISTGTFAQDMTAGPDGALWFAEEISQRIGRITTDGAVTSEYPLLHASSNPVGITAGPDGALWFSEYGGGRIGRVTTAGALTEYTTLTGGSEPYGVTVGPDGAIWFVELSGK